MLGNGSNHCGVDSRIRCGVQWVDHARRPRWLVRGSARRRRHGPFNAHFVRDIGAAYLVAGAALAWFCGELDAAAGIKIRSHERTMRSCPVRKA